MTPTEELVYEFLRIFDGYEEKQVDIPGKPVPASRPRVTRWGTYYSKTYTAWRNEAASVLREALTKFDGQLAVLTEVVAPRPKTTKLRAPRGDIDNFEKAAWDAVTSSGAAWRDDAQIVATVTTKRYAEDGEKVGIFMTIYEIEQ